MRLLENGESIVDGLKCSHIDLYCYIPLLIKSLSVKESRKGNSLKTMFPRIDNV